MPWKLNWRLIGLSILCLIAPCSAVQANSLPPPDYEYQFTPHALDWQPFRVWRGLMIIDVDLDGHQVPALIDTGTSWTTISEDIDPNAGTTFSIDAIGGKAPAQARRYRALKIGGVLVLNGWVIRVTTTSLGNVPFHMLLGADVLGAYAMQVDWTNHRLRFLAPGDTPPDAPAVPVRQELAVPGDPGKGMIFTTGVTLCGKALRADFDTGADANMTLLASAVPRSSCPSLLDSDVMTWGFAGSTINEIRAYPSLAIGAQPLGSVPVEVAPSPGGLVYATIEASIGNQVLRRFNYTLDAPAGRLVLWGPGDAGQTDDLMTTGAEFDIAVTNRAVIAHVMHNSPAAAAALKAGDGICAVDGQHIDRVDNAFLNHVATPAPGTRIDLSLCDGRRVTFAARDYLGQAAALAAIPMPSARRPVAWLTEAMIACNPDVGKRADICRTILDAAQPSGPIKGMAAAWMTRNLITKGDYANAAVNAARAIGFLPSNATLYLLRAEALMDAGRYADALPDIEKASALAPALSEAQQFRAFAMLAMGRYAEGLAIARPAIATTPDSWWANAYAAYALCRLGRPVEARPLGAKAMALDPKAAESWAVEALLMKAHGNDAQAEVDIAKALTLGPDDALAVAARTALSPAAKGAGSH